MHRARPQPIIIKQYGAPRSGTNALRAMLERGLPRAMVLMHVLGDKHQPPAAVVREPRRAHGMDAYAGVQAATRSMAGATTDGDDAAQADFLARWSPYIWAAVRTETLRCVVSVKDPYAWVASRLRLRGLLRRGVTGRDRVSSEARRIIAGDCERFNQSYRSWLPLVDERPGRWTVARHIDLVRRPGRLWRELCSELELSANDVTPPIVDDVVLPTHWDDHTTAAHFERFDRAYYAERRYLAELGADARALVTALIDWPLIAPWGYEPLPVAAASR